MERGGEGKGKGKGGETTCLTSPTGFCLKYRPGAYSDSISILLQFEYAPTIVLRPTLRPTTLWLFLNLDLKLFYLLSLSLNTDPTCRQRLWSYDRMALGLYCIIIIIIIIITTGCVGFDTRSNGHRIEVQL